MSRIGFNGTGIRSIAFNQQQALRTLERLATGSQINRASDNPAGLIASESFAARLSANQAQITSIERNEAFLNIRDGALGAQLENLGDLDGLVVQAANEGGLTGSELGAITTQVNGALNGIGRVLPATGIDIMNDVTTQMEVGTDEATGDPIYEEVSLSDLSRVIEQDPEAAQPWWTAHARPCFPSGPGSVPISGLPKPSDECSRKSRSMSRRRTPRSGMPITPERARRWSGTRSWARRRSPPSWHRGPRRRPCCACWISPSEHPHKPTPRTKIPLPGGDFHCPISDYSHSPSG